MNTVCALELRERGRVQCEVLTGNAQVIERLAPEWHALCDEGPCRAPFYRPEWIAAYVRAFEATGQLVVITARAAGRLIGVLPLVRASGSYGGVRVRKLVSAGNVHTVRFDLVHGSGPEDLVPEMWQELLAVDDWDVLELTEIPRAGMGARLARYARDRGFSGSNARAATTPYLVLDTAGDSGTLTQRLDAKFRANLRRRGRKLEERGAVKLVETREAAEHLERFYALERKSWKGEAGSAIACDSRTRQFYDEIAAALGQSGQLSIYTLYCGEDAAAMYYGMWSDTAYYLVKTAFDARFRDCSPGQLITQRVLEDLSARGCTTFHFLGWMADWKRDWRPRLHTQANWYLFRGARGQAAYRAHFQVRRAVGRTLRRLRRAD